jgi:hypothetical protein
MHASSISAFLTPQKVKSLTQTLTWTAPAVVIPSLRFVQDVKARPETANELFIRDFTSYAIGATCFLVGKYLANKGFKAAGLFKNDHLREFTAFLTGLTGYLLYSGIGALKVANHFSKTDRKSLLAQKISQHALKEDAPALSKKTVNIPLNANFGNSLTAAGRTSFLNNSGNSNYKLRGTTTDVFEKFKAH